MSRSASVYGNTLSALSTKAKPSQVVKSNQGGSVYEVDSLTQASRFFHFGSYGNYYVGAEKLTMDSAQGIVTALDDHGTKVVDMIVNIAKSGSSPRPQALLMGLALACAHPALAVRRAAFAAISVVCGTGTMLFEFASYVQTLRGWGRGLRSAVGNWYETKSVSSVVYQAIKYQSRVVEEGSKKSWTHRDILNLAHPSTNDDVRNAVYKWIVYGTSPEVMDESRELNQLYAFEAARQDGVTEAEIINLIELYKLPREAIPAQFLKSNDVWMALLQSLPMMATVRNLAQLTTRGLLTPQSDGTKIVIDRLGSELAIKRSKIHPMNLLTAQLEYKKGYSSNKYNDKHWTPVPRIIDALDSAFYLSYDNVVPTNRSILCAIDTSGSTSSAISGFPMSCFEAEVAVALITLATEPNSELIAFNTNVWHPTVSPKQRLDDAIRTVRSKSGGGTRLSSPVEFAMQNRTFYDGFAIYTDNENGGPAMPVSLDQYRRTVNNDARVVVSAMTVNKFSCARPSDVRSLDVVGFSTEAPALISSFIDHKI